MCKVFLGLVAARQAALDCSGHGPKSGSLRQYGQKCLDTLPTHSVQHQKLPSWHGRWFSRLLVHLLQPCTWPEQWSWSTQEGKIRKVSTPLLSQSFSPFLQFGIAGQMCLLGQGPCEWPEAVVRSVLMAHLASPTETQILINLKNYGEIIHCARGFFPWWGMGNYGR